MNTFQREADKVELSLTGDSRDTMNMSKQLLKWDRKKKKLTTTPVVCINVNWQLMELIGNLQNSKVGKIKTESGVWIPASYKGNRYSQWKQRTKAEENAGDDADVEEFQRGPLLNNGNVQRRLKNAF